MPDDIEIEEPTEEQRRDGMLSEAVRFAARGSWDSQIVAYLVTQQMPKEEARELLPEIRKRARPDLERLFRARRAIGWFFVLASVALFYWVWKQEVRNVLEIAIAALPLIGGIRQILKNRTPADEELGIG